MLLVVSQLFSQSEAGWSGAEVEFHFYNGDQLIHKEQLKGKVTNSVYKRQIPDFEFTKVLVNKNDHVVVDFEVVPQTLIENPEYPKTTIKTIKFD